MAEPTAEQIAAFQRGWYEQDVRGDLSPDTRKPGDRTRAGLTRALAELTVGQIHDVSTPGALITVLEHQIAATKSGRERAHLRARLFALAESIKKQ